MPSYSSIDFESTVAKKKCRLTVDVTAEYDEPIAAETMREILVQVAITLTNPKELDSLARELATPGSRAKADTGPAASQGALAPPLLRTNLRRLK